MSTCRSIKKLTSTDVQIGERMDGRKTKNFYTPQHISYAMGIIKLFMLENTNETPNGEHHNDEEVLKENSQKSMKAMLSFLLETICPDLFLILLK